MKPKIELPGWALILQELSEEIENESLEEKELKKPSEKNVCHR
jgi:hypothetical protein